jgi:diguanylate cyclase (GGDEF)-like protein
MSMSVQPGDGSPDPDAELARVTAELLVARQEGSDLDALIDRATVLALAAPDPELQSQGWYEIGAALHQRGDYDASVEAGERLLRLALEMNDPASQCQALALLANARLARGDHDACLDDIAHAGQLLAADLPLSERILSARLGVALVAESLDLFELADEHHRQVRADLAHFTSARFAVVHHRNRAALHLSWGLWLEHLHRPGDAARHYTTAVGEAELVLSYGATDLPEPWRQKAQLILAHAITRLGQDGEGAVALALAGALTSIVEPWDHLIEAATRAILAQRSGDSQTAASSVERMLALAEACGEIRWSVDAHRLRAALADQAGDIATAVAAHRDHARVVEEMLWMQRERQVAAIELRMRLMRLVNEAGRFALASLEDPLTGLANRRRLEQVLHAEDMRSRRSGLPLGLMVIDIDRFKHVNDAHSHLAGDEALRWVASSLASQVRSTDIVARYAGDEFVAVLPGCDEHRLRHLGERARSAVEGLSWSGIGPGLQVTVSIGLAVLSPGMTVHELFAQADANTYEAKRRGGNLVCG